VPPPAGESHQSNLTILYVFADTSFAGELNMADQWFYASSGEKLGPFSSQQLRDLAQAGTIQHTDTIWKGGIDRGVLASHVKNLFAANSVAIPAAPIVPAVVAPSALLAPAPALEQGVAGAVQSGAFAPADATPPAALQQDAVSQPESTNSSAAERLAVEKEPNGKAKPPKDAQQKPRKGHAIATKGAVIVSQDGTAVFFRKKCTKCGHEDASKSRMPIRNGSTRHSFFCPKCRKLMAVEIQGSGI
jgi:hypothetical protein